MSELTMLVNKKEGFLKRTACVISFFENEILVTKISKEKQKELLEEAKNDAKAEVAGFLKSSFAMMKALPAYADEIAAMSRDDIKKEDTEVILKEEVVKVKYRNASNTYVDEGTTSNSEGFLVIKLSDKKIKFTHNYEDNKIKKYIKDYK